MSTPTRDRTVVAVLGAVTVHAALAVALAGVERQVPLLPPSRDYEVELFELEPPAPPPEPPPPEPPPPEAPPPEPPPPAAVQPQPRPARPEPARRDPAPPQPDPAPAPPDPDPAPAEPATPGAGAPVVRLPDVAPGGVGVPVARGQRPGGRTGGGGSGGGAGAGTAGDGTGGDPPPRPASVASIKTRARPRGDYGYFDARKDYPPEARRLGVEGQVKVRLSVDAEGRVTDARLLTRLGHGLDELALTRARALEFDPALDADDRPVASVVVWTFTFALPE